MEGGMSKRGNSTTLRGGVKLLFWKYVFKKQFIIRMAITTIVVYIYYLQVQSQFTLKKSNSMPRSSGWVKVPGDKPNKLSSIPSTHTTEGENELPQVVLQSPQKCWETRVDTDTLSK